MQPEALCCKGAWVTHIWGPYSANPTAATASHCRVDWLGQAAKAASAAAVAAAYATTTCRVTHLLLPGTGWAACTLRYIAAFLS